MRKLFSVFAIAAIAGFAFVSCNNDDKDTPLKGIKLSLNTADVIAGEELVLKAVYDPEDADSKPQIVWKSSDTVAAKVVNGTVYAKNYGKYVITATADQFSDSCVVSVKWADPEEGDSKYAIIGLFHGVSNWSVAKSLKMKVYEQDDRFYCIKNITLIESDKFKIWYDNSWTFNRGGHFGELGKWFDVNQDGDNVTPGLTGTYDIYYYKDGNKMAITEHNVNPEPIQ